MGWQSPGGVGRVRPGVGIPHLSGMRRVSLGGGWRGTAPRRDVESGPWSMGTVRRASRSGSALEVGSRVRGHPRGAGTSPAVGGVGD